MAYKGIDVSKHNVISDWAKIKAEVDFVMIRAGLGTQTDEKFAAAINNAHKAGLAVGVYWFAYALNTKQAVAEADYCVTVLKSCKLELPVYYDFEYDTERYAGEHGVTYTPSLRTDIISAFCEKIKGHGYTPGVYTNVDYIASRLIWDRLKLYKLWLASWVADENTVITWSAANPAAVSTKWGTPQIWQIGKGNLAGVGDVDINYGYMPSLAAVDIPAPAVPTNAIPATVPTTPSMPSPAAMPDVSVWAKDSWAWAKANGVCDGTRPKDTLTREEAIAMLYRLHNIL
jgi:Lyzozyme M1 (1,4-beta-N-acetylmuramidase)